MLKNTVLIAALGAALAGCTTIGPDFKAPATAADASWRHAAATDEAARLPARWWTVFGDATLDDLEGRALRDNPGVKAAAQRLLQAQAQLGVVRAGQLPSVAVSAATSWSDGVSVGAMRKISADMAVL